MRQKLLQGVFDNMGNEKYHLDKKIDKVIHKQNSLLKFQSVLCLRTKSARHKEEQNICSGLLIPSQNTNRTTTNEYGQKDLNINNYINVLANRDFLFPDKIVKKLLTKLKQKSIRMKLPNKITPITPLLFKFHQKIKKNPTNTCFNTTETSLLINNNNAFNFQLNPHTRNRKANLDKEYSSKTLTTNMFSIIKRVNTEERKVFKINKALIKSINDSKSLLVKNNKSKSQKTAINLFPLKHQMTEYTYPKVTEYITKSSRDLHAFKGARNKLLQKYKSHI